MPELSEAYVLGLLADVEAEVPKLRRDLEQAQTRAAAVDAELSQLLRRLDEAKRSLEEAQDRAQKNAAAIAERNARVASLHQEIAGLKRRSGDIKVEMERVGPGAISERLRRDRARLANHIEDREHDLDTLRNEVDTLHAQLQAAEGEGEAARQRIRAVGSELDRLQSQLPSPNLYVELASRVAAGAHCRFFLDRNPEVWNREVREAIDLTARLHRELRAGKYRLDRHSDIVGGRANMTGEAMYGAVAIGEPTRALELFRLATDPSLFFHQIFPVFRVWCLGLYLERQWNELRDLLRIHQYAVGLRGAYVDAFSGLLRGEAVEVARGLAGITKHEWDLWQDVQGVRGAGVVNLGAAAIGRLALERRLSVRLPGPTTPDEILAGPSRRALGR